MPNKLLRVAEWGFFDSSTSINSTQQQPYHNHHHHHHNRPHYNNYNTKDDSNYHAARINLQAARFNNSNSHYHQQYPEHCHQPSSPNFTTASFISLPSRTKSMGIKKAFRFSSDLDLWDPSNRFQTSWLLSPRLLFLFRFLFGIYALTTRIFSIAYRCSHANLTPSDPGGCSSSLQSFSYFTILTYWGLAFYFLVSACHTFLYALRGRCPLQQSFPRYLKAAHSLLYTTVVVYPFIVTIVYWAVLFKGVNDGGWFPNVFVAWENVSQHALNSAFALFEILFTRTDMPLWAHLFWLIVIIACYLALAFVTVGTQGFYTYSFLNHDVVGGRAYVAAYVVGILAGLIVVFGMVRGLIWMRIWVTETKWGMKGKLAELRSWRRGDIERASPAAAMRSSPGMKPVTPISPAKLKRTSIGVAF